MLSKERISIQVRKVWIAIILSIVMISCTGQVKTESATDERSTPVVNNSIEQDEYKDDLFFIEGQLCQHLREIFEDSKGRLWMGTNVYDLMLYSDERLKYITEKDGFDGGRVTGIIEDDAGNLWFSTGHGLYKYDGASFALINEANGMVNSEIWSMLIDSKGVFWIGHNQGLSKYDGDQFENISIPKAAVKDPNTIYSENRIVAITEDAQGNLWFGTDGYGICKYDGQSFTSFTTEDGLVDNTISELLMDSDQNLWVGTFWGGLSKYDGDKFINYTKDGRINGVEISALYEDSHGDIWIGVEHNGVYKYSEGSFTHYNKKAFSDASILSIYEDSESRYWFGGWGGLFLFDGAHFMPVSKDGPWDN